MYVIRPAYLQIAIEKCADPQQLPALEALASAVSAADQLSRAFPDKLAAARAADEIPQPPLSRAAHDQIQVSADASRRVDQLLTRACNRASDATAVLRSLVDAARDDLDFEEFVAAHAEDQPLKELGAELLAAKRAVVHQLESLLSEPQ